MNGQTSRIYQLLGSDYLIVPEDMWQAYRPYTMAETTGTILTTNMPSIHRNITIDMSLPTALLVRGTFQTTSRNC